MQHTTLTHPAYAGAYVYGRTRDECYLAGDGALRKRRRGLPRDQWEVLIPDHHPGFIDWHAKMTLPTLPFGDGDPADRQRPVATLSELGLQLVKEAAHALLLRWPGW